MDEIAELKQLILLMNENDLVEIELVYETGRKVRLKKSHEDAVGRMVTVLPMGSTAGAPAAERPAREAAPAAPAANLHEIVSPMVGTFYRKSSPEADPYVDVGDHVTEETVVCIIEAMKVMNEIKAEVEGEVVEVLVENGEAVEYGQALFRVKKPGA